MPACPCPRRLRTPPTPPPAPRERARPGNVAIVGDAAHPVRPTGQGLNMSLEDAYCLAKHLATAPPARGCPAGPGGWLAGADVAAALDAYRRERLPRVSRIMAQAQVQGAAGYKRGPEAAPPPPPTTATGAPAGQEWSEFLYRLKLTPLSELQPAAPAGRA
jgi:salicylate hydroxylase